MRAGQAYGYKKIFDFIIFWNKAAKAYTISFGRFYTNITFVLDKAIRLYIPLFRQRFYLVFLFGRPFRSPARRERDRAKRLLWSFGNIVTFVLFLLLLIPTVIGAARLIID